MRLMTFLLILVNFRISIEILRIFIVDKIHFQGIKILNTCLGLFTNEDQISYLKD